MDVTTEVLLVEDSEDDVYFMQRAWADNEIPNPLKVVKNGRECLDWLETPQSRKLGLILMDINMPVMNGIECLRHIRKNAAFEHLPVVMLSGNQLSKTVTQTYRIGCNSFIEKPQDYVELQQTVNLIHRYWYNNRMPEGTQYES